MTPCITIITVVYNNAKELEDTIKNVQSLKCTYNVDFIVIDGGSSDGSLKLIRKYESLIKYWTTGPDKGIYDAMNKGWAKAHENSYLLFLGAGDAVLSLPDLSRYDSSTIIVGDVFIGSRLFRSKIGPSIRIGNTIHHQALLIHKSLNPEPPFNIKFKMYADFDFNQRLVKRKIKFVKDDKLLSFALPGGYSSRPNIIERCNIVYNNFGVLYSMISLIAYMWGRLKPNTEKDL